MSDWGVMLRDELAAFDGTTLSCALGEYTAVAPAANLHAVLRHLRDNLHFEQLIDIIGVDYADYPNHTAPRFAAVYHLLSIRHNRRIRIRAFCPDDSFPLLDSATPLWSAADWYEREAFDLFGIIFRGHPDLRRILTDYGFIGHPFRKDFPISGYTEMRYDPQQKRVIYQPVSIPPREITPRIIREDAFGGATATATESAVDGEDAAAAAAAAKSDA